jgi:Ca2+-transporting ATPase
MRRPPRSPRESIFDRRALSMSLLQGLTILIASLGVFIACRQRGLGVEAATMAFTTLVAANLALILVNVSWKRSLLATLRSKNQAMWWVIGGAFTLIGLMLYVPFLSGLLNFHRLNIAEVGICLGAGLASVIWFELWKLANRRR